MKNIPIFYKTDLPRKLKKKMFGTRRNPKGFFGLDYGRGNDIVVYSVLKSLASSEHNFMAPKDPDDQLTCDLVNEMVRLQAAEMLKECEKDITRHGVAIWRGSDYINAVDYFEQEETK